MESNCPHCGSPVSKPNNTFECGIHWCFTEFALPDPNRREWSIGRKCLQNQLTAAQGEVQRLREENEQLRKGAPLGPIIGAQTILEQEQELKRLREIVKLPKPDVGYKAVMARSEQLKRGNDHA